MPDRIRPLEAVIDDFSDAIHADGTSVGALVHAFEDRSLGAVLVLLSGLQLIPIIGAIPGATDVLAGLVLIFIVQSWIGRKGVWVPQFIGKREIGEQRLDSAIEKARPWAQRVDALLKTRLSILVKSRIARLGITVVCAGLAMSIFVLGFVPFAAMPPSFAILAFGLALLGRDGLMALIGYLFVGGTLILSGRVWGMVF
ncbi:Uncharacterized conserved protein [Monaibacterium marinum]|uniref:Uncharacterized conserved protein n=1 Tax=Pontivivens marinum TaxID=1690039 RepID=A0A2C9CQL3_9RHOB|nr:exopolysaccharide biosynthesis protein [Monaibacterium marinum]SOH92669.1 Uncharacterized conserved protein [Monaibacterium marinum]